MSVSIIIKGGPGSGHHGHRGIPGQRGGSLPGTGSKVWSGEAVPRGDKSQRISKLRTGEIGEQLARQALAEKFGVPFVELNQGLNNAPVDIAGDHHAVEVKAGLATNGKTAQHWRATIGQPGKAEAELISKMTNAEKRQHNIAKEQAILARKNAMLEEMSEAAGATIKPATVGVILSEDGSRGDVYFIPGFHLRLPWQEYATDEHFLGTYDMTTVQKGGPGSGHHGHGGLKGVHGGSTPGSGGISPVSEQYFQERVKQQREAWSKLPDGPGDVTPHDKEYWNWIAQQGTKYDYLKVESTLKKFTENSQVLNAKLRNGQALSESEQKMVNVLDSTFQHPSTVLDRDITVYRGTTHTLHPNAYVSTTITRDQAANFGGGNVITITVPKGSRALFNPFGTEEEIILPRGTPATISKEANIRIRQV